MPVHDLSAQQLEKLVRRLGATADAYKEAGLYPPPQVISELRRAKSLYEQKKVPPKPNVEKQYNNLVDALNQMGYDFGEYMDGDDTPEEYIQKTELYVDAIKLLQKSVKELEEWKGKYEGRK